jgi:hypothetical protein
LLLSLSERCVAERGKEMTDATRGVCFRDFPAGFGGFDAMMAE